MDFEQNDLDKLDCEASVPEAKFIELRITGQLPHQFENRRHFPSYHDEDDWAR